MSSMLLAGRLARRHHDLIIGAGNTLPAAGFLNFDINTVACKIWRRLQPPCPNTCPKIFTDRQLGFSKDQGPIIKMTIDCDVTFVWRGRYTDGMAIPMETSKKNWRRSLKPHAT